MANPTLTFQQRKDKAKKLAALYAKALDASHKIAAELKGLGFDPQGKQLRTYKDSGMYREPGRDREPAADRL